MTESLPASQIREALERLRAELPSQVQLIAVSKTKAAEAIEVAYAAGQRDFGENRVQEMLEKYERLPQDIRWHMIGHLQSNKIKYMAPFVYMVHGVDKAKRLKELNKEAAKCGRQINCLLQIHIAEEESKFGFDYPEAAALLAQDLAQHYPHLRIRGLMGMATFSEDQAKVRAEFAGLKRFFDAQVASQPDYFDTLSMGMTGDYQLAVAEGSTMLRIGSAIFGSRA